MLRSDNCDLIDQLGFDSLLIVELVVEIENALDFEFDMNNLDVNRLRKLCKLKEIVDAYLSKGHN